jgi:hypothetical protein
LDFIIFVIAISNKINFVERLLAAARFKPPGVLNHPEKQQAASLQMNKNKPA